MFPVNFTLDGKAVWLAWLSDEQGERFFSNGERPVFAGSERALEDFFLSSGYGWNLEDGIFFDLDGIESLLARGVMPDANAVLDVWNLFSDFSKTIDPSRSGMFMAEYKDTYSALFSMCDAADIVRLPEKELSSNDIENIRLVMASGRNMILGALDGCG